MTLNIKDAEADRVVRALAEATGESITVAVTRAAEERLERVRSGEERRRARRRRELHDIVDRFEDLPALNDLSEDQILGYDERGIPT